jgi:hypothetical protein
VNGLYAAVYGSAQVAGGAGAGAGGGEEEEEEARIMGLEQSLTS